MYEILYWMIALVVPWALCLVAMLLWIRERRLRKKRRSKKIAVDKNGNYICLNSRVLFRGQMYTVSFSKETFSCFLVPEDDGSIAGRTMPDIPFTSYIARECEVASG